MEVKYKAGDRNWWSVHVSDDCYPFYVESSLWQCWAYTISKEGAVVHSGKVDKYAANGKPTVSECLAHFMAYMSGVCFGLVEQTAMEES